jgi:hypothetical protein
VFELRWQDTMAVDSAESSLRSRLDRIGLEHGEWRVVAMFGDRDRAEAAQLVTMLANQRG